MSDERIKEPTPHQKALAKMLRSIADALDCGEVTRSVVTVHYGQIDVQADASVGDFRLARRDVIKRKGTGHRVVSIALQYDKDIDTDTIAQIVNQEACT